MCTLKVPGVGAVRVSDWVAGEGMPHRAGARALPAGAARASVPDEGDTVGVPASGATCQRTDTGGELAEATPSCTVVGCPTTTVAAPLGDEKPMAGSTSEPNEGGTSAGDDPQAGSGELVSV